MLLFGNYQNRTRAVAENLFGITSIHEMSKPMIVVGGNNDKVYLPDLDKIAPVPSL